MYGDDNLGAFGAMPDLGVAYNTLSTDSKPCATAKAQYNAALSNGLKNEKTAATFQRQRPKLAARVASKCAQAAQNTDGTEKAPQGATGSADGEIAVEATAQSSASKIAWWTIAGIAGALAVYYTLKGSGKKAAD